MIVAKLLVSDPLARRGIVLLERAKGIELANEPGSSPGEFDWALADADARAVRSDSKFAAGGVAAGAGLRVVGR